VHQTVVLHPRIEQIAEWDYDYEGKKEKEKTSTSE
jgi:hypothetical protein